MNPNPCENRRQAQGQPRRTIMSYRTGVCPIFLMLLSVSFAGAAGDHPYAVDRIPAELRANARAVVRLDERRFEVRSKAKARYHVRQAVTIFTKEARDWGEITLWYDRFRSISDLDGAIYDADGAKIRSLKSEDVLDASAVSGYSLYEENRVRHASLYHDVYPYTVEYEYEVAYKGSLNWPGWDAQGTIDAVERTSYEVVTTTDLPVRTWCNRDTVKPRTIVDGNDVTMRWEASGLPALPLDITGYDEDLTTVVHIAPVTFTLEDHEGSMESWRAFGQWVWNLFDGKDRLPDDAIRSVQALIRPGDTPREKARKVYQYVQSRIRYVSIQLGIGGWQPFDASYVHERGYGDCKALVNYTIALLHSAGLNASPAIIFAGRRPRPLIEEFPSNQFNHVIACVPTGTDTLWLECTSRTMPFGRLANDCAERGALVLTPGGGVVVTTPAPEATENLQRRTATIQIHRSGSAQVAVRTRVTGAQGERYRSALAEETADERRAWATRSIPVANASVRSLSFAGVDERSDTIEVSMTFDAPRVASVTGARLFFVPNLFEQTTTAPARVTKRLAPVRLPYRYLDSDSLIYRVPEGFSIESLPAPVDLAAGFGRYRSACRLSGDTAVVYVRTLEMRVPTIPAAAYEEYRTFFTEVAKADRMQAVLVKK